MRFASTVRIATLAGVLASSQIAMAAEAPTYTKDIAPIMFRSCVSCHRPGEIAPMSLLNYDAVRPWAKAIKRRVVSREMPPWFADKGNTPSSSATTSASRNRKSTSSRAGSTPARRRAAMPTCRRRRSSRRAGATQKGLDPDCVIEMPAECKIPAEGEVPNISFFVKSPFSEDKFFGSRRDASGQPRSSCTTPGAYARTLAPGTRLDARPGEIIKTENDRPRASEALAVEEDRDITFGVARLVSFSPGRGFGATASAPARSSLRTSSSTSACTISRSASRRPIARGWASGSSACR